MTDINPGASAWATRRASSVTLDPNDAEKPFAYDVNMDHFWAYLALWHERQGPNDSLTLVSINKDDRDFAMDQLDFESLPVALVIDWDATARNVTRDFCVVPLPDGRSAYFR